MTKFVRLLQIYVDFGVLVYVSNDITNIKSWQRVRTISWIVTPPLILDESEVTQSISSCATLMLVAGSDLQRKL